MTRKTLVLAVLVLACSTRAPGRSVTAPRPTASGISIRVALATPRAGQVVSATSDFNWLRGVGTRAQPLASARARQEWRVEREQGGERVRVIRPDGVQTAWHQTLTARPRAGGLMTVNGRRYRGEIILGVSDRGALQVVNRLPLDDYVRGVVAVEMGNRTREEAAAVQAQAIASRTYALARLRDSDASFDVRASVLDQAYGGVDAENDLANAAVEATGGMVLLYRGRLAEAFYSSTCGGRTAEPTEAWRSASRRPYLKSVSDRIGESQRYYCDIGPRFTWERTFPAAHLQGNIDRYLRSYANIPTSGPGRLRRLSVTSNSPSGRVAELAIETDRGTYTVRGDDIRYVIREPGGEILSSAYFSVEPQHGSGDALRSATFRGRGHGHGVGMCQWGAIGRARAGQSYLTILRTYYPGTTVGPVTSQ